MLLMGCNCSTSCDCTTDLGCFDPCGDLATGLDAFDSADYTLSVGYLGRTVKVVAAQTAGEEVVFPLEGLNENFTYQGVIINPDGDVFASIKFTTSKTVTV
jgi:hypothetical protein